MKMLLDRQRRYMEEGWIVIKIAHLEPSVQVSYNGTFTVPTSDLTLSPLQTNLDQSKTMNGMVY